jgi:hypothetical protein
MIAYRLNTGFRGDMAKQAASLNCFDTGECLDCEDGKTSAGENCEICAGTGRCVKCNQVAKENEDVSESSKN